MPEQELDLFQFAPALLRSLAQLRRRSWAPKRSMTDVLGRYLNDGRHGPVQEAFAGSQRTICSSLVFGTNGYGRTKTTCIRLPQSPTTLRRKSATGHQRTVITLQERYLSEWLSRLEPAAIASTNPPRSRLLTSLIRSPPEMTADRHITLAAEILNA